MRYRLDLTLRHAEGALARVLGPLGEGLHLHAADAERNGGKKAHVVPARMQQLGNDADDETENDGPHDAHDETPSPMTKRTVNTGAIIAVDSVTAFDNS